MWEFVLHVALGTTILLFSMGVFFLLELLLVWHWSRPHGFRPPRDQSELAPIHPGDARRAPARPGEDRVHGDLRGSVDGVFLGGVAGVDAKHPGIRQRKKTMKTRTAQGAVLCAGLPIGMIWPRHAVESCVIAIAVYMLLGITED